MYKNQLIERECDYMTNKEMAERIKLLESTINKISSDIVLADRNARVLHGLPALEDSITFDVIETNVWRVVNRLKEINAINYEGSAVPISSDVNIDNTSTDSDTDDKLVSNLSSALVFIEDAMFWTESTGDPNQIENISDSLKVAIKLLTSVTVKRLKEGETNNATSVKTHARN